MKSSIRGHPDAPVPLGPDESIDSIESSPNFRPVSPIKLPYFIPGNTPNLAILQFQKGQWRFRTAFVRGAVNLPMFLMITGRPVLCAYPEVTILSFEQCRESHTNGGIGTRENYGLKFVPVERVQRV